MPTLETAHEAAAPWIMTSWLGYACTDHQFSTSCFTLAYYFPSVSEGRTSLSCTMPSPKPDSPNSPSNAEAPTNVLPSDNPIEADEAETQDGDDDGYNSDLASTSSTSISSSIRNHTFEDGIRYHRFHDGQYAFPNDDNEQNRDDMKHAMTLLLCGQRHHFAPIGDSPQNIIDLGRFLEDYY